MRVGVDATFLADEARYTGMGVYTRGLAAGLATLGRRDEIVLLGYGPRPAAAPPGLRWHAMAPLPAGRLGPWLSHQVVLPRTARRLALDVLHVTGVNVRLSRPGVPFFAPCPLVVTVHDLIPLVYYGRGGPPLPWRLRLAYRLALLAMRRAAVVVAVSDTSRRDILTHLSLPPDRVRTVYNGLDFPAAAPPGARMKGAADAPDNDEERRRRLGLPRAYLLYAGSYEPRKNLGGAVAGYREALGRRPLPPLVLLVERESGHRRAALEEIERSGVADRLRIVHSLSDEDLAAVYRGASLFLYPSFYEGFGFVPLQALACGLPVIAADAGSLPEVLGDAACFVDPASPARIAEAIVRLTDRPEEAAALAARGPAQAARFRWEAAGAQTMRAYDLAAGYEAPAPAYA